MPAVDAHRVQGCVTDPKVLSDHETKQTILSRPMDVDDDVDVAYINRYISDPL